MTRDTYETGEQRNHSDEELIEFLSCLDKGQTKLLELGGTLPLEEVRKLDKDLTSNDVARAIQLSQK